MLDDLSMGKFKNLPNNVRFIKGNILNYKTCKIACRNQDAVIHLAAKVFYKKFNKHFKRRFRYQFSWHY